MPSATKVHWAQLRVGLMAALALALLSVLVFLLTGDKSLFTRQVQVSTFMDDSAALTEGSPVRLNGILVGKIRRVVLTGESTPNRIVRIEMDIDEDKLPMIPVDSMAMISAENLLGSKQINIKKGTSANRLQPGGELPSLDTREFDDVVQQGYNALVSLRSIIEKVDKIVGLVEAGKGSIGRLIVDEELYRKLLHITAEVEKISSALSSGQGTIGKLLYDTTLYDEVRSPIRRIDAVLADLQQGQGTAGKLLKDPALYDEVRKTVAELRKTLVELNEGKGTAGKLLKSEELHNQIQATIGRLDRMMDRLNAGEGTLGQLLVNPQLYESINGLTREMNGLMKDFRANPKKFLRIKLALF